MSLFKRIFGVSKAKSMGSNTSSASKATANGPAKNKDNNKKQKKLNQKEINKIIQRLYDFEEMLQKKIAFIESQIDKEIKNARRHGKKNKRAALGALRRKRNMELKIERLEGTVSTIELQREALENVNTNADILRVIKQANTALQKAHSNLNVDSINQVMDEVAEQQEFSREVNEAVANPVGFNQEFDEDELIQELDNLIEEENDNRYKKKRQPALAARHPSQASQYSHASINDLPEVPQDGFETMGRATLQQRRREDEAIRQLEQWAVS